MGAICTAHNKNVNSVDAHYDLHVPRGPYNMSLISDESCLLSRWELDAWFYDISSLQRDRKTVVFSISYTLNFFCCRQNKNSLLFLILNSKVKHISLWYIFIWCTRNKQNSATVSGDCLWRNRKAIHLLPQLRKRMTVSVTNCFQVVNCFTR